MFTTLVPSLLSKRRKTTFIRKVFHQFSLLLGIVHLVPRQVSEKRILLTLCKRKPNKMVKQTQTIRRCQQIVGVFLTILWGWRFKGLTILTGKDWCFSTQFSTGMAGWLLLIFLIYLHNRLSSIHSIISTDV